MSKSSKIGVYRLGPNAVHIFVDPDYQGGDFTDSTHERATFLRVGLNHQHYGQVVATLLHELFELASTDFGVRYKPSVDFAEASDGYVFHMNHAQFSEVVARVGYVAVQCLPAIEKHYKRVRK